MKPRMDSYEPFIGVHSRAFAVLYLFGVEMSHQRDLICFENVIVDAKTIECITDHELGQMLNYLKVAGQEVGVILNFKRARLEWKRVVLQKNRE